MRFCLDTRDNDGGTRTGLEGLASFGEGRKRAKQKQDSFWRSSLAWDELKDLRPVRPRGEEGGRRTAPSVEMEGQHLGCMDDGEEAKRRRRQR